MRYRVKYVGEGKVLRTDDLDDRDATDDFMDGYRQTLSALRQGVHGVQLTMDLGEHVIEIGLGEPRVAQSIAQGGTRSELQFHGRIFWMGVRGFAPAELCLVLPEQSRDPELDAKAAGWLVVNSAVVRGSDASDEVYAAAVADVIGARPVIASTMLQGAVEIPLTTDASLRGAFASARNGMGLALLEEDAQRRHRQS